MSQSVSLPETVSASAGPAPSSPESRRRASGLLLVLSAPSGGGKTTLCEQLIAADPKVRRAVTCTTRAPRPGEQNGVDYHFLPPPDFELRTVSAKDDFLEHALVHGHHYGTLKSEVLEKLRAGYDVLLSVDVQGAAALKLRTERDAELKRALVTIFLAPPSLAVLEQRLRSRGTDAEETIARRLSGARAELARWREYDYLIVSDTVATDLRRMLSILTAERLRSSRVLDPSASLE